MERDSSRGEYIKRPLGKMQFVSQNSTPVRHTTRRHICLAATSSGGPELCLLPYAGEPIDRRC